jgi:hypothetical protein
MGLMNSFTMMWRAVNPTLAEIDAARVAFEGVDVTDLVPRLVMVRRAVAADFYSEALPNVSNSAEAADWICP